MADNPIIQSTILAPVSALDLHKTFTCGQCFRWTIEPDGAFSGVALGHAARLWTQAGQVWIESDAALSLWRHYFDLDTDYRAADASFQGPAYLDDCREHGAGIRILRQDPWEALCSFIMSQCNNIPRIRSIIDILCSSFGQPMFFKNREYYTFPEAERIASLELLDLAPLRSGYRASYLLEAARAVAEGRLDLAALAEAPFEEAVSALRALPGIGEKVASCVVLYGLHRMDAFPVDVWMKRALKEHFPSDFDPRSLGPYAGLAQQYIFFYARNSKGA